MLFAKVLSLSLLSTALALPTMLLSHSRESVTFSKRAGVCIDTCGSTCYYQTDIDAALNEGYSLFESGNTLGSGSYPHQYNDYEGFDLPVSGPWYEFPILHTYQVYRGGSPGADRVLFNGDGEYAGLITHTGASGDDFDQCTVD